ncbi:murein biosynthesis integral membrane protein MurJ [Arcanobacterium haemolyticum]|nr:murein biosynthesis integral membrane protein MurJ [Arcanobacterium haemolyticum]
MSFRPKRPLGRHIATSRQVGQQIAEPALGDTGVIPVIHEPDSSSSSTKSGERTQTASVARSSFIMFLGTLTSRFLGLVRSPILLGAVVGMTSPVANSFDVANKIPNLIYMLVVGGLVNAVLVPAIVKATKQSDDDGQAFINKLLTLAITFLGAITLVLTVASPWIVKLFAATMQEDWYKITVAFAYWCLPQIFFYGMYTIIGQVLNAKENFGPYMWAPALNNVVAVAGLLVILAIFGPINADVATDPTAWAGSRVALLGGFSTLGIIMQALILLWPLKRLGIHFRFDFKWRGSGLGDAGRASWWMLLMMLSGMIPTMVQSNVAASATARAEAGGLVLNTVAGNYAYTTAYTIYSLPTSLIVVSIATAMFTRMSRAAVEKNFDNMRRDTSKTLRTVSSLMFLSSVGLIVLAVPVSRLLATTISSEEVLTLSRVVVALSLGLVGIGAVNILDRVYYAFEDTRGAFLINLTFQVLGIIGFLLSSLLPPQWVVVGIGVTMSVTNILSAFVMLARVRRRLGRIDGKRLATSHLKLLCISIISGMVGAAVLRVLNGLHPEANLLGAFVVLAAGGLAIILVYVGLMALFRMEELRLFASPVRGMLRKIGIGK